MRYETRKIIKNKIIFILFAVAVIYNSYLALYGVQNKELFQYYAEAYDDPESNEYKSQLDKYDSINEYRDRVKKVAVRLMDSPDEYVAALNEKLYNSYEKEIEFKNVFFSIYMERSFGNAGGLGEVMFLMCFLTIAAQIFYVDVSKDMICIIRSTYKSQKTFWNKMNCLGIFSIVLAFIKIITDFLPMLVYGNQEDMFNPIQSLSIFEESPWNINLLELMVIYILLVSLGFLTIGMIAVLSANVFKKLPETISVVMIVCGVSYYIYYYLTRVNYVDIITITSDDRLFTSLVRRFSTLFCYYNPGSYFEKAEYINVFGIPVKLFTVAVTTAILFLVAMVFVCRSLYLRRDVNVRS